MELHSEKVLRRFRTGACDHCKLPGKTDPAHIFACGQGNRVDAVWNLCRLCRLCHVRSHNGGHPTAGELLTIAAKRNKCEIGDILDALNYVRYGLDNDGNVVRDMPQSDNCERLVDAALKERGPAPKGRKRKLPVVGRKLQSRPMPKYIRKADRIKIARKW